MKLKEALEKKKFVVTSEVQAPMGDDDPEALVENLKRVRGRMDGVSIAEVEHQVDRALDRGRVAPFADVWNGLDHGMFPAVP